MSEISANSRILYTEPNFTSYDGADLPTKLEDLSITVDLIVETKSRFQTEANNATGMYVLSWSGTYNEGGENASFLNGKKLNKNGTDKFLTTYYTDITYDDAKNGEVIEGLGITSINIDFDSWYMPQIAINFTDVRGVSLFVPNEYAAFNSGESPISNGFYKSFFTFPYPQFKLKVKGFYGNPVTYVLNCVDFKGEFNSETGNFDSIAKFIGFNYAFLSDIQLQYLVAAPYDTYCGKSYFESKLNSEEWALEGGGTIPTLVTLQQNIANGMGILTQLANNDKNITKLRDINDKISKLNDIRTSIDKFISYYNNMGGVKSITVKGSSQYLFFLTPTNSSGTTNTHEQTVSNEFLDYFNNVIHCIVAFNEKDFGSKLQYPNSNNKILEPLSKIFLTKILVNGVVADTINGNPESSLMNKELNNGMKMDNIIAKRVVQAINEKIVLPQYCYLYDTKNIINDINDTLKKLEQDKKDLKKYVDEFIKKTSTSLIGFNPSIYNISKILFAHLETLIHCVYNCENNVKNRTFNDLSISLKESDIVLLSEQNTLPAFPAIRKEDTNTNVYVDSWIGEVAKDGNIPEEAQLIYGFTRAVQQVVDNLKITKNELNNSNAIIDYIPVCPMDICLNENPFKMVFLAGETLGNLIGQLGIRMSKVLGVTFKTFNNVTYKFSEQAGQADAINYWTIKHEYKDKLSEILSTLGVNNGNGSDLASDKILKYLMCNEPSLTKELKNGTNYYEFEIISPNGADNTMYEKFNNSLLYNLIKVDNMPLLPSHAKAFGNTTVSYSNDYGASLSSFKFPDSLTDNNAYFYSKSDEFANNKGWNKSYINDSVFTIIDNDENVNSIIKRYNEIKDGKVEVENVNKNILLSELISDKIWKVENDTIFNYYESKCVYLTKYLDYEKIINKILPTSFYSDEELLNKKDVSEITFNNIWDEYSDVLKEYVYFWGNGSVHDSQIDVIKKIYDNSQTEGTKSEHTILVYPTNLGDNSGFKQIETLFGSPFYYLQNENTYESVDILKTKSLLFLQTFSLNCLDIKKVFNNSNGVVASIPKLILLLMGGLLWRKQFCEDKGFTDCFKYKTNSKNYGKIEYKLPSKNGMNLTDLILRKEKIDSGLNIENTKGNVDKYNAVTILSVFGDLDIFSLRLSIKNKLIKHFEKWVLDNQNGFSGILTECELRDKKLNNALFDAGGFIAKVQEFKKVINVKTNYENIKYIRDNFSDNILLNYANFVISNNNNGNGLVLFNRENTNSIQCVKDLFVRTDLVSIAGYENFNEVFGSDIIVNEVYAKSYLNSFIKTLSELITAPNDNTQKNPQIVEPSNISNYRDLNIAMYNYFKKLHDSWFIGKNEADFTVKNFFEKSFVFIDSFYNKIGNKVLINCEYLLERFNQNVDKTNLYSFLADVYAKHGMLFVATPNFNDWNNREQINNIFKPIAYNSVPNDIPDNNFICMYVHEPSKTLNINGGESGIYGFAYDGFDIHDPVLTDDVVLEPVPTFKHYNPENSMYVPAFGVAFGKQNQSYFKNIRVGMNTPVTTEQSINSIYQIAKKGGDNSEGKGTFWGQDLYSVWSNYSYTCEIEMLGCAQIQPLMYFQLFNIPLFRGTYIVTKVTHNIKPGYMTTNITGTKLCKYGKPFLSQAFGLLGVLVKEGYDYANSYESTVNPLENGNNITKMLKEQYTAYVPSNYGESYYNDCPKCNCCQRNGGFNGVNINAKQLFSALSDTIKHDFGGEWGICVYSGLRNSNGDSTTSDHYTGNAIDIAIVDKKGNLTSRKTELAIVFDILLTCYSKYLRQLIWEDKSVNTTTGDVPSNCIHFAVKNSSKQINNFQVFQAYLSSNDTVTVKDSNAMSKTFLFCLAKHYNNGEYTNPSIQQEVLSFNGNVLDPKKLLNEYYGRSENKPLNSPNNSSDNSDLIFGDKVQHCDDYNEFKSEVINIANKYKFNPDLLMISMMAESGLNPHATNGNVAVGLIQFTDIGASAAGITKDALLGMKANEQIKYVGKFFDSYGDSLIGKFKRPIDIHLYIFAPSKFISGSLSNDNAVIYAKGTKEWQANAGLRGNDPNVDITVKSMTSWYYNKARENARALGYISTLDKALSQYSI